jgi:integrase
MLAFYGPSGEVRKSSHTRDEKKALDALAREIRRVENDRDGIEEFETPSHRRVKVSVLFSNLLAYYREKGIKGLEDVEIRLREGGPLQGAFGGVKAASLTTRAVSDYMKTRRAGGLAKATVNREVELLRTAFRLAAKHGVIRRCPVFPEKLDESDNVREGFFEADEFSKLLPRLPGDLADVARFGYLTGWRRGMILGLTWEEVDRKDGSVRLPGTRTKNGKPLSVPLDEELSAIIERRASARSFTTFAGAALARYVFHREGRPINETVFGKQWRAACVRAGLGRYEGKRYVGKLFHDFRRTAARNMVRAGVPESVAMSITGHRTRSMFERYNVADERDKLKALRDARAYSEASRVVEFRKN